MGRELIRFLVLLMSEMKYPKRDILGAEIDRSLDSALSMPSDIAVGFLGGGAWRQMTVQVCQLRVMV